MNDSAGRVVEKGADTFLAALSTLDPGTQLALLTITGVAILMLATSAAVIWFSMRFSSAIARRALDELRHSSDSAMTTASAVRSLHEVVKGVESSLQANTLELARSQSRSPKG